MNPQLSRLLNGRTEIRIRGAESVFVVESPRDVRGQLAKYDWAELRMADKHESEVHLRSSAVYALVDLNHHEGPKPTPLFPQEAA